MNDTPTILGDNVNTVLCADSESLDNPSLLGLDGEEPEAQPWLVALSDAGEARELLSANSQMQDVWVFSSDTVDGINLAAAIKADGYAGDVSLMAFGASGSIVGRCEAAGIKACTDQIAFLKRYGWKKQDYRQRELQGFRKQPTGPLEAVDVEEPAIRTIEEEDAPCRAFYMPDEERPKGWLASAKPGPDVSVKQGACIISIFGAAGGVGRSSVSALFGLLSQKRGLKTLVIDADLQFGDLRTIYNQPNAINIIDLAANPQKIERLLPDGRKPALLAAPPDIEQSEIAASQVCELLAELRKEFDVIIVNTASLWQEYHLQLVETSTYSVMLFDQRPSSVRGGSRILDLFERCAVPTRTIRFALNRCAKKAPMGAMDVSCALHGVKVFELRDGGPMVAQMLGAGMVDELLAENNDFVTSVIAFADSMLPSAREVGDAPRVRSARKGVQFFPRRKRR